MSLQFAGKNILVVVAHQDDESLYFGGLLCELVNANPTNQITIACMTEPMPGRKDTLTRVEAFKKVCHLVQANYRIYNFKDYNRVSWNQVKYQLQDMQAKVSDLITQTQPQAIFTHNKLGEPNPNYTSKNKDNWWNKLMLVNQEKYQGHITHKLVHEAVKRASNQKGIDVYQTGIGLKKFKYEVYYNMHQKKALLDCYLPQWSPKNYNFCYLPERYTPI